MVVRMKEVTGDRMNVQCILEMNKIWDSPE